MRAFALSLPAEALRPADGSAGMGKDLLVRMSLELGLLPEVVVRQPKQSPSTSPVDAWYAGPLHDQVLRQLEGLPFAWDRRYVEDLLRPKWAEEQYRRRVSIDRHALRAIGLLMTYAGFTGAHGMTAPTDDGHDEGELLDEESLAAELVDGDAPDHGLRRRRQHSRPVAIVLKVVPYAFVGAMVLYLFSRRDDLAKLGDASIQDLALLAALVVVGAVLNATEYWVMYRAADIDIGFRENVALFNAGQLGNYLPMQVGTMYRFRYLKVVHQLRYANTASFLADEPRAHAREHRALRDAGAGGARGQRTGRPVVAARRRLRPAARAVPRVGAGAVAQRREGRSGRDGRVGGVPPGWENVRRQPAAAIEVLLIDTGEAGVARLALRGRVPHPRRRRPDRRVPRGGTRDRARDGARPDARIARDPGGGGGDRRQAARLLDPDRPARGHDRPGGHARGGLRARLARLPRDRPEVAGGARPTPGTRPSLHLDDVGEVDAALADVRDAAGRAAGSRRARRGRA